MPPNQAEIMFKALQERGIATALVMFPGANGGDSWKHVFHMHEYDLLCNDCPTSLKWTQ